MSDKSNKYGYVGVDIPAQSFGANKGVFNPDEINELVANNQWTTFGQLELIETQTYSSAVSYVDFTAIQESTYNVHFITLNNLQPTTDTALYMYFYESGVLETASVYQWARQYIISNGTYGDQNSTALAGINLGNTLSSVTNDKGQSYIYIYNAGDSSKYTFSNFQDIVLKDGLFTATYGSAVLPQASTVDGFRFSLVSGNFSSFDISLYGIAES